MQFNVKFFYFHCVFLLLDSNSGIRGTYCSVKLIFICDISDLVSVFVFPYLICHDPLVHPF